MTTTLTMPAPAAATDLREATRADFPALARVLTRAFADDPVAAWFFPDDTDQRQLARFYAGLVLPRLAAGRDEIYADAGGHGAALWTPPGKGHMSALDNLRLLPRMAALWGRRLPRALRGLAYMESKLPETPHWHLFFLGVDPEAQGQGIGSALMRPMLERCDREGTPVYLEASTVRSRALYLRHGFEVLDEMRMPDGGPPLWRMWRAPLAA